MKEQNESKGKSYLPFLAIVAVVAIVAIVVLVMNYGQGSSTTVVDEEGNVVGESVRVSGSSLAKGIIEYCSEDETKLCCKSTVNECRPMCQALKDGCWRTYTKMVG